MIKDIYDNQGIKLRDYIPATNELENIVFADNINGCSIACIDIGMHKDYVYYPLPVFVNHIWKMNDSVSDLEEVASNVSITIINYQFI